MRYALAALAAVGMLVSASAANAASVSISGSTLSYAAAVGEENDLSICLGSDCVGDVPADWLEIDDFGVDTISKPASCSYPQPGDQSLVHCPAAGIALIDVQLRGEDDIADLSWLPIEVTLDAGSGDDEAIGGDGGGTLRGGSGDDTIEGGAGDDRLFGDNGDDNLDGGGGNNVLDGGRHADYLSGWEGVDTVDYSSRSASQAVTVTMGEGVVGDDGHNGVDCSADPDFTCGAGCDDADAWCDEVDGTIENALGTAGADAITGTEDDNVIVGNSGNDTIDTAGGDDTLDGGAGNDILIGAGGNDTADYSWTIAAVAVNLNAVGPQNTGAATGSDALMSIENVSSGRGADTLIGDAGNNVLVSGAGADTVEGGPGVDTVAAGAGNDTVHTRDGVADSVDCGDGTDSLVADPQDTRVACENVDDGTPPPQPAGGGAADVTLPSGSRSQSAGTAKPRMTPHKTTFKMSRSGKVTVNLTCPAGIAGSCSGNVTLIAKGKIAAGRFRSVGGGRSVAVALKLSAKARKQVKRKRKLKAKLTVAARDAAADSVASTTPVTIRR